MIGCKKNPKYAPKDPFPQKVKDLCKSDEEVIASAGILKHTEKVADICAQPQNYPDLYTYKTYQYMYPRSNVWRPKLMFCKNGLNFKKNYEINQNLFCCKT